MQLFGKTFQIIEKALELRSQKSAVISSNLVNIDTPGYRARDLPFKKIMEQYLGNTSQGLQMEETDPGHMNSKGYIKPSISNSDPLQMNTDNSGGELLTTDPRQYRFGTDTRSNNSIINISKEHGTPNDVDLDIQMAKLAKNNLEYQATVQSLVKELEILKEAVIGGGRT